MACAQSPHIRDGPQDDGEVRRHGHVASGIPHRPPDAGRLRLDERGGAGPQRSGDGATLSIMLHRRFGVWAAIAMIVAEVMGVGIFLTPAGMVRTLANPAWVLGVWALMGLLSVAGALCYAELGTRFPGPTTASAAAAALPSFQVLGGALMGAFFAFGGWWDLGKMSEEIVDPKRTLPVALVGGIVVVTVVYAGLSVALMRVLRGSAAASADGLVVAGGSALF